mmetsp:Transcript_1020/g.1788  ORF Transcript_1020/g.1788 Transcript_1020/m.1788 type:complete len:371 (-) Transcript_1020:310-1422(-)
MAHIGKLLNDYLQFLDYKNKRVKMDRLITHQRGSRTVLSAAALFLPLRCLYIASDAHPKRGILPLHIHLLQNSKPTLEVVKLEEAGAVHDMHDVSGALLPQLGRTDDVKLAICFRLHVPSIVPKLREERGLAEEVPWSQATDGVGVVKGVGALNGRNRLAVLCGRAAEAAVALDHKVDGGVVHDVEHGALRVHHRLQQVRHGFQVMRRHRLEHLQGAKEEEALLQADAVEVAQHALKLVPRDSEQLRAGGLHHNGGAARRIQQQRHLPERVPRLQDRHRVELARPEPRHLIHANLHLPRRDDVKLVRRVAHREDNLVAHVCLQPHHAAHLHLQRLGQHAEEVTQRVHQLHQPSHSIRVTVLLLQQELQFF